MTDLAAELAAHPHGRVPRALRERQLLSLAGELFAERGYTGASMDELASRAGVSKPVIYDLIGKQGGAVPALRGDRLDRPVRARRRSRRDPPTVPRRQLRAGSTAFFRFAAEHRKSWDVLFAGGGEFARDAAAIRSQQTTLVAAFLAQGAREMGVKADSTEIDAMAHALNGAFESLAHWASERPEIAPETLTEWIVALMLPGLQRLAGRSVG